MGPMPAVSLAAVPGRRGRTMELAQEIERRGFTGIYGPSVNDVMGLCRSLAHVTTTIRFGTSIQPIYLRQPVDLAQSASAIHELSDGRFRLGIGVSHGPANARLDVKVGAPLSDMRGYVEALRASERQRSGPLPPIVLAALRDKMLALAVEIADGAVWANAARSHMAAQLAAVPPERIEAGFFVGCMIPTVIDDDRAAASQVHRRTLSGYVALPNYRNYWKQAGYVEEMEAIEAALASGRREQVPELMSDRWLSDVTLFGSAHQVREGVEEWLSAGVSTPILVPSSSRGGQMEAFEDLFEAFA